MDKNKLPLSYCMLFSSRPPSWSSSLEKDTTAVYNGVRTVFQISNASTFRFITKKLRLNSKNLSLNFGLLCASASCRNQYFLRGSVLACYTSTLQSMMDWMTWYSRGVQYDIFLWLGTFKQLFLSLLLSFELLHIHRVERLIPICNEYQSANMQPLKTC